ncbi:Adaptin ear-binding coat-associated protein 2 (NECAP-2) isoform 2 family protein [Cardiosporidium cionae]|uniref:Adaptin ear-binding coat-associated protein 2 (NECAP-2) isoform 2 family protein n=1 Tax=Cardiosporidium cionae TaxID=476202 RepID=A0ABQ7JC30_9APIC|nr:Adaptin ear-binding coat-associated protein 2 (NECAP-2) isoform 2 family protein [Cardiosporidium cionae]|eukprot:KAF8821562.1 Adaptin ear-binding coat-associated protein 2 (NECAP-2) isoform 2 family protein [Cardiosporidium cionae]
MDECEELEYVLLNKSEVFVYKIPTRPSLGHRAEDWTECIWRGKLQVTGKGDKCTIKFLDSTNGSLYAQCPLPEDYEQACERTVDSSRYFAVRVDNGKGRHAFIGMGFESRNDAFDFNCTLSDFSRRNHVVERDESLLTTESKVHRLEEGEKITVKLRGMKSRREKNAQSLLDGGDSLGALLPPPPSSTGSRNVSAASSNDLIEF